MKTLNDWQALSQQLTLPNQAYINGQFQPAISGQTLPCINPSNQALITNVASCDEADVNLAVESARRVFNAGVWSEIHPAERKKILLQFVSIIEQHKDELALIDTLNMGKPISEMVNIDLPSAIETFQWAAEYIDKVNGDVAPTGQDTLVLTNYEPVGVVACIVPWNYPLMLAVWKIAPALAAGNSVILKPSEKTPLSVLYLAQLATEAGLPPGVLNVLPGLGETAGKALASHMDVDVMSFSGSSKVAGQLMEYAGQSNLKRVWIEGGGKSPNIVFADCADLKKAAAVSTAAAFSNQGEVCIACTRVYVEKSIKTAFVEALKEAATYYQAGDPMSPETTLGPIVDEGQLATVEHYIGSAMAEGGQVVMGGLADHERSGLFVQPTIIDEAHHDMTAVREEIFGPVITVCTFETEAEAIALANDTKYGLAAAIWTADLSRAHRVSAKINSGMVWINTWGESEASVPFGGRKASGNGRDKSHRAMEKYMEPKTVCIRL